MFDLREGSDRFVDPAEHSTALMARACLAVSGMFTIDAAGQDGWAEAVAGELCALVPTRASAMVMVGEWAGEADGWRTIALGLAGGVPDGAGDALREQAARGWPRDDISRTLGHASARPTPGCGRREEMVADDLWSDCAYARFRESIGLFDFARAVAPFDDEGTHRVLMLQLDGLAPSWRAPRDAVTALECVTTPALRAYRRRFIEPTLTRRRVLESLSPMQRRIVPLLADGLTEAQIAEVMGRSRHTVHDHTRAIYRSLDVKSRRALRDLWLGRPRPDTPCNGDGVADQEAEDAGEAGFEEPSTEPGRMV